MMFSKYGLLLSNNESYRFCSLLVFFYLVFLIFFIISNLKRIKESVKFLKDIIDLNMTNKNQDISDKIYLFKSKSKLSKIILSNTKEVLNIIQSADKNSIYFEIKLNNLLENINRLFIKKKNFIILVSALISLICILSSFNFFLTIACSSTGFRYSNLLLSILAGLLPIVYDVILIVFSIAALMFLSFFHIQLKEKFIKTSFSLMLKPNNKVNVKLFDDLNK